MRNLTKDQAYRLVSALADRYGWEYCGSYGEPGYQDDKTIAVVLGDYWIRKGSRLHKRMSKAGLGSLGKEAYPHMFDALAEAGVQFEWYDEWLICYDTDKAYRTTGDSWGWSPSTANSEAFDLLTPDDEPATWLEYAMNDYRTCVTPRQCEQLPTWLEANGWTRQPEDGDYESGWFSGQNADPEAIYKALSEQGNDVVFVLTENSQFYSKFVAYYKESTDEVE